MEKYLIIRISLDVGGSFKTINTRKIVTDIEAYRMDIKTEHKAKEVFFNYKTINT